MASSKIKIDGDEAAVLNLIFDNADHMLIVTDASFSYWLRIDQTAMMNMQVNTPVHLWGNPGRHLDIFRVGAFEKWEDFDDSIKLAIFIMPIYAGDSGGGVLDESGAVVAVVSLGNQSAETATFPLQFTSPQLGQIR